MTTPSLDHIALETAAPPQHQDFAGMYTSYLRQAGGIEVQLVKYD
jgi:hypothetical protein